MINPVETYEEKKKSVVYERKKKSQVSSYVQEKPKLTLCEKVLAAMNKKDEPHFMEIVSTQGASLVISDAEPNVETFASTSDKVEYKTTKPTINIHVSSTQTDERFSGFRDENSQYKKLEAQDKKNIQY